MSSDAHQICTLAGAPEWHLQLDGWGWLGIQSLQELVGYISCCLRIITSLPCFTEQ